MWLDTRQAVMVNADQISVLEVIKSQNNYFVRARTLDGKFELVIPDEGNCWKTYDGASTAMRHLVDRLEVK